MAEDTALAVYEKFDMGISLYGDFRDSVALAQRIKRTVPGADKLDDWNLVAYANYCIATGANPHRDMHAWQDKWGNLQLCEDYKLLVRWAMAQESFTAYYEPMDADRLKAGDIGYNCHLMRESSYQKLDLLCKAGIDPVVALRMVRTTVGGIVRAQEASSPCNIKGWDWITVAQKRSLKNALNQAYGMPSLAEIARMSWNVDGIQTEPEDWEISQENATPAERRETARYKAKLRKAAKQNGSDGNAVQAIADLFGDDAAASFVEGEVESPETDYPDGEGLLLPAEETAHIWTPEEAHELTEYCRTIAISNEQALEFLGVDKVSEFAGNLEIAKKLIDKQIALEIKHTEQQALEAAEEAADG
jgi:hypothetical protein